MEGKKLIDVLIVVTRYFGGILLGKGGLVRAYTKAALAGLEEAEIIEIKETMKFEICCDYAQKDKLLHFLEKNERKTEIAFSDRVKVVVEIPVEEKEKFEEDMDKLSNGQLIMNILS